MDSQLLQLMYQQWIQEKARYYNSLNDFAKQAAAITGEDAETIANEVKKCQWYKREEE
jgi:hypothetical protein